MENKVTDIEPEVNGIASKLKTVTLYQGDLAVYGLTKSVKKGKEKTKYVLAGWPKSLSGVKFIRIWASTKDGVVIGDSPLYAGTDTDLSVAFSSFGYTLV